MTIRQCSVWLVSLAFLLVAYWGYTHFNQTPRMDLTRLSDPNALRPDREAFDGQGGQVKEDVKIWNPGKTVYKDLDDQGRVYREWGFESLYHQGRDVWRVKNVFMNLFAQEITCCITADQGSIQFEDLTRNRYPRDVTFAGNVYVHIVPDPNSSMDEMHIYLDDISFVSEKSRFSTKGAITLKSQRMLVRGKHMQFVYNQKRKRLQYFQLHQLDILQVKVPRHSFFPDEPKGDQPRGDTTPSRPSVDPNSMDLTSLFENPYQCVLNTNVAVRTPKQLVVSREKITFTNITDIIWNDTSEGLRTQKRSAPAAPSETSADDPNLETIDLVVTCDNGLLLTPSDSNWVELTGDLPLSYAPATHHEIAREQDQSKFEAAQITYNTWIRDTVAQGPLELTFYAPDMNDLKSSDRLIPIKVTAKKQCVYLAEKDTITLDEDCLCTLMREDPNIIDTYALSAPTMSIHLSDDKDRRAIAANIDVDHLEATGRDDTPVTLGIYTRTHLKESTGLPQLEQTGELLAGTELKCRRFTCDPNTGHEVFTAIGPGTIRLNNSKSRNLNQIDDTHEPCYAFLDGFETLKLYVAQNIIVADANDNLPMVFDYYPIIDGLDNQRIRAQANHIEIHLVRTENAETELGSLTASGLVHFENDQHTLLAENLSYDHQTFTVNMWNDSDTPCYYNDMKVKRIKFNMKTSELEAEIIAPGTVPLQ